MKHRYGLPAPLLSLTLLAAWLLLADSTAPGQWLLGSLFAWALPLLLRRFRPHGVRVHEPLALLRLLGLVAWDIAVANVQLVPLILGPGARLRPAFIEVPLDLRDDFALTVLASIISLTPGTVSTDLSADRRTLLVHALHTDDPEALAAHIKQRYETPLREIFGC